MKLRNIFLSALLPLALTLPARTPAGYFAPQSRLAGGQWVKIGVDQTGVYEISYETLRQMGFADPSKVGVYGIGGLQAPQNFLSAAGARLYYDDVQPVAVLHHNNKIYFYGQSSLNVEMKISSIKYDAGGYFSRTGKNIYTDEGCYFLSDSEAPTLMEEVSSLGVASLQVYDTGIGRVAHEVDLIHNDTESGQLFFGEKLDISTPRREWNLYLPGAIPGAEGAMECYFYTDRDMTGTFSYGFNGTTDFSSTALTTSTSTNYKAQEPAIIPTTVPGEESTAFIDLQTSEGSTISNLDYWVVSYQRTIPDLKGENSAPMAQDFIGFPRLKRNSSAAIRIPGGASFMAIDVTVPSTPKKLNILSDGADGLAKIQYVTAAPQVMIFDPYQPQLQIKGYATGYERIANQNLHEQLAQGADLIIICIPQLKEAAERLAEVHRQHDGIRVVVATTEECYNEFSYGKPDPMAYRAAIKMAYDTDYSCKNALLLGPLYGDFRGIVQEKQPLEGIIAYQAAPMSQVRGSHNANDLYGMMDDFLSYDVLEKNKMQVGIGILPVRYDAEAHNVIDKVEKFLEYNDFAYLLNTMTNIGGVGDNHTHDNQVKTLGTYINRLEGNTTIITPLIIDAYGYKLAQNKLFDTLNEGRLLVNYFGHGSTQTLNQAGDFFTGGDVYRLRNSFPCFMSFAGCELSEPDRGIRGMGESMVTSTPYGMVGTLLATRETWSGQNMEFFQQFYTHLFRNGNTASSPVHERPLTIGEVFALTKTQSTYTNELAYQLVCDPALVFPVVTRSVVTDQANFSSVPGDFLEISGYIPTAADADAVDASYNGTIVIRLMQPIRTEVSADLCTANDGETSHDFEIQYADTQISMTAAEVKNGKFTAKILVPASTKEYIGQISRLHFAAYSPDQRIAAGLLAPLTYLEGAGNVTAGDTKAPSVHLEYDATAHALNVTVTDDVALSYAAAGMNPIFTLTIDGKPYPNATLAQPKIDFDSQSCTRRIPLSDIAEGTHSAIARAYDAAGNQGVGEISFDYLPSATKFAIAMKEKAAAGQATIESVGQAPENADIIILDANGMIVCREAFRNGSFIWDTRDLSGAPVAPGLYKAYLLETGSHTTKGHSASISIPVL